MHLDAGHDILIVIVFLKSGKILWEFGCVLNKYSQACWMNQNIVFKIGWYSFLSCQVYILREL